jgi:hypothetical protein
MRGVLLAIVGVVLIGSAVVAVAAPTMFSPATAANMTRPCGYQGKTSTNLSITSASAATSSALTPGVVRMVCTTAVHFRMASTSPTAVTTDSYLPANTVEWFVSEGAGSYVAAIRNSADGTCYLTVCN